MVSYRCHFFLSKTIEKKGEMGYDIIIYSYEWVDRKREDMRFKLRDKIFACVCVLLCGIALWAGVEEDPYAQVDQSKVYAGFKEVPKDYTADQAIQDGLVVYEQHKSLGGAEVWKDFYAKTQEGTPARVRIMQITDLDGNYYLEDLFFNGKSYEMFVSIDPYKYHYQYKYLLDISGTPEYRTAEVRFVILTDVKDVTFEQLHKIRHSKTTNHSLDYKVVFFE